MSFRKRNNTFPAAPEVECRLFRITYNPYKKGKDYETIALHFRRGSKRLSDVIYFPSEDSFNSVEEFQKSIASRKTCIERLGVTFLGVEKMAEINRKAVGLDDYFNMLYNGLCEVNFSQIPVVIKTWKDRRAYLRVSLFSDYIRRKDDNSKKLEYNDYEIENSFTLNKPF